MILEKNALQAVRSPFIIHLLGTYQDQDSVYFLTDVVMGGDLMTYMIDVDILENDIAQFLVANLCEAIAHIHEKVRQIGRHCCCCSVRVRMRLCAG